MAVLLREAQAYFDAHRFDPGEAGYERLNPRDAKIAHIGWHVGKIVGRKLPEWWSTGDRNLMVMEIIPDLAIYGTQLANLFNVPDEAFVTTKHSYSIEPIERNIQRAFGQIADYIEPREHGEQSNLALPQQAAIGLYGAAVDLATELNVHDLHLAQRLRMEALLKHKLPESVRG